MDERQALVWEIGVEEIPSQYLDEILAALGQRVAAGLEGARLAVQSLQTVATPRRLVVAGEIASQQTVVHQRVRGPQWGNAFRDGEPTPALLGFAGRLGVPLDALTTEDVGGKRYVVADVTTPAEAAIDLVPGILEDAAKNLPLPRSMRWGSGEVRFIRPVRWTLAFLDDAVLDLTVAGVQSQPFTYGNRTDHPDAVELESAHHYWGVLPSIGVMVESSRRENAIQVIGNRLAESVGGSLSPDPALLHEVARLVEWPTPFLGRFDESFLEVPEPILVTTMKVHQRYFPVFDPAQRLLPYFVGVRNGVGEALDQVRRGNEKVLRARLNDAAYFYHEDVRHRLDDWVPHLAQVVFQAGLGSYADKVARTLRLYQATRGWWGETAGEMTAVVRAVTLAKADLLSHVVQELPELQGQIGELYARRQGESDGVAQAIGSQYLPRSQQDPIPGQRVGQIVALLDRVDTLTASLGAGVEVSGSEDPFGLRRAAMGVGRILAEGQLPADLHLVDLVKTAASTQDLPNPRADTVQAVSDLVRQRIATQWEGMYPSAWVRAVMGASDQIGTYSHRLSQLAEWVQSGPWESFLAAYKRVSRVVPPQTAGACQPRYPVAVEEALAEALRWAGTVGEDRSAWWQAMPTLIAAVNALFDAVLVMDPDPAVRERRLELLAAVRSEMGRHLDMEAW